MHKGRIKLGVLGVLVAVATVAPMATQPASATFYGGGGGNLTFTSFWDNSYGFLTAADAAANADGDPLVVGIVPVDPSWSPDGTRLAFADDADGNYEIFTSDADGSNVVQLTTTSGVMNWHPSWSPDGTKIVFTSNRAGNTDIYAMSAANGSGLVRLTTTGFEGEAKYSPDGKKIAFINSSAGLALFVMPAAGGTATKLLADAQSFDWSPDGKRLVAEVPSGYSFLLAYVNPDGTHFTSIDVGLDPEADSWNLDDPTFSPDGTRLAFSFNCLLSCDTAAIVTVKTDGTDWHYVASDPDIALDYLAPAWRPGPKLVNSVLPSIHGTPMDGSVLTASNGTWFGTTPIDTYQWIRCSSTVTGCAAITGQTASTHTLTSADVGHRLEVTVTATNGSGSLAKTSGATVTIAQRPPSAYMLPVVTGSALRGHTLSTTAGLWHGTALSAPLYRWYRCNTAGVACVYITGATHSTYTVTAADHPWRLRSRIFRSNLTGTVAAFSNPTAIVP